MEATVEVPSAQTRKDYTSRPGALSRFFRMSRDGWKSKYKALKATSKPKNVSCLGFPRWVTWWGMPGAITRANRAMVGN